jgi:hypothetical protein
MATTGTTVGPLEERVRDRLKEYRDREGHPNYNVALDCLLREAE